MKKIHENIVSEFGITVVKQENPNQIFSASSMGYVGLKVETDGKAELGHLEPEGVESSSSNPDLYKGDGAYIVTGATWTIVEGVRGGDVSHHGHPKILYTLVEDLASLIPELQQHQERKEQTVNKTSRSSIYFATVQAKGFAGRPIVAADCVEME